jgi:hypothetical protein
MLSTTKYGQDYIDGCRDKVAASVAAYKRVATAAKGKPAEAFEPLFFNTMVIVLDAYFTHRARNLEGKDGNPMNEVRVLCNSLMTNDGRLLADKQIKLAPATSQLQYAVGDEIKVTGADFARLSKAYFAAIESTYT